MRSDVRAMLAVAVMALAACGNEPTPAGTKVLDLDTREDVPAELRKLKSGEAGVTDHQFTHALIADDGQVTLDYSTAKAPGGGQYILDIGVTVTDPAGYTVTAERIGNPVNLGSESAPVHLRMVQVGSYKKSWGRTTGGTRVFRVRGDGKVEVE